MKAPLLIALTVSNLFGLLTVSKGRITDVTLRCQGGDVLVSCVLDFPDEQGLRSALEAGETLDFTYQAEVCRARGLWFDELRLASEFRHSLTYNNLTKQYFASFYDGGEKQGEIILPDFAAAREWLTRLHEAVLRGVSAPERDTYVQLRVVVKRRRLFFVLPLETASPWRRLALVCP